MVGDGEPYATEEMGAKDQTDSSPFAKWDAAEPDSTETKGIPPASLPSEAEGGGGPEPAPGGQHGYQRRELLEEE